MNKRIVILIALIAAAVAGSGLGIWAQRSGQPASDPPKYQGLSPAQAEALENLVDNTLHEHGTLESGDVLELRCEISGGANILSIVDDGAVVKKGEELAELDVGTLRDQKALRQIALEKAQASVHRCRQEIEIAVFENDENGGLASAKLSLKAAELALQEFVGDGGDYQFQLLMVDVEIVVADSRLKSAGQSVKRLEQLQKRGAAEEKQLEAARLIVLKANTELKTAQAKQRLLSKFTYPRQKADFDAALAEAKTQLKRKALRAITILDEAKAELKASTATLLIEQTRLQELMDELNKSVLRAPRDGIVVHAASNARRSNSSLEVGAAVKNHQVLLRMPNTSRLHVTVSVHETSIGRVRIGQLVKIQVPGSRRSFRGRVVSVGKAPNPTSWFSPDVTKYTVIASLENPSSNLKIGMTALVEIEVSKSGE